MDASTPLLKNQSHQVLPKMESEFRTMRSRSPSFSSFSFSFSFAASSLQRSCSFPADEPEPAPFFPSGVVPFSWEHQPGIPKNQAATLQRRRNSGSGSGHLPLPPSSTATASNSLVRKKSFNRKSQRDPFAAALVRCSKDDENRGEGGFWVGAKLSRNFSGRLGVIASCKQSCSVSEAIVRIPTSNRIITTPTRFL